MKYRKKPVEIEAFQYNGDFVVDNGEWSFPKWALEASRKGILFFNINTTKEKHFSELFVKTLEGNMHVSVGDYIIQGVQGEIYPCKAKIFEMTYEPVEEKVCKNTDCGSYECYHSTNYGFDVDKCLVDEINKLNDMSIRTIGCCCGHSKKQGYIQVSSIFVQDMLDNGYEQLPIDKYGNGKWCFKPKSVFPN